MFQFDENGVIDGMREVLQILQDETGLPSCSFLLTQDVDLDGLSRLKALSRPDLRPYVLRAAKQRGHQGPSSALNSATAHGRRLESTR